MKKVNFDEAIGHPLAHDICEIKGQSIKRVAFKRGHIILENQKEDFAKLGKQNFYILEAGDENLIHEEDAAIELFKKCNNGDFLPSEISMGKINFIAKFDGFFKVSKSSLIKLNMLGEISAASINNYTYIKKGDIVASMRIIPLFTTTSKIDDIKNLVFDTSIFKIQKIKVNKIGLITTGSEVYNNKIKDGFRPVLDKLFKKFNLNIEHSEIVCDEMSMIESTLKNYLDQDYDLIILTGGMSVDPDDLTPGAIKNSHVDIISYGSPIIPGSMFLLGYYKNKTIIGLPGAVIFEKKTALDVYLPKILLKEKYTTLEMMSKCVGGILND